jgi:glucose/mannose-6-phosphate isomerase
MDKDPIREAILEFPEQLSAGLEVANSEHLPTTDKFIVCGMGGSALAAGLLRVYKPELDLLIHRDYGLPRVPKYFLDGSLLILSSYSGSTEEVLDVLDVALSTGRKSQIAIIADSGPLLKLAKEQGLPHIDLPGGLPPRLAVGLSLTALGRFCLGSDFKNELRAVSDNLAPADLEPQGIKISKVLNDGKIPIIYSSALNLPLAYSWKVNLNETGKIPAFYNVIPEANHNELESLDSRFRYLFLRDPVDGPRLRKRFEIFGDLLRSEKISTEEVLLPNESTLSKIFTSNILAFWTTYHLASSRGIDPAATPRIESFKHALSG